MLRGGIVVRPVRGFRDWLRIRVLYRVSFPASERKPFFIIRRMHRRGKTDVLCAFAGKKFAGFASTINGKDKILLDYLAVPKKLRGCGAGSAMLSHMFGYYREKGVFVEIENPFEVCENTKERMRRRDFYIRNGMAPLNVYASVFGVSMELLGRGVSVDFEGYRSFYRDNYSDFAAAHILPSEKENKVQ